MPDWLKTLIHDVVLELLHAELSQHGVLTTPAPTPKPPTL